MCKLFGWINRSDVYDLQKVNLLVKGLVLSETDSNPHGFGLLIQDKDKKLHLKKWESGYEFILFNSNYILEKFSNKEITFIMGHLRFATHGEISQKMAHPYELSEFVGCHNGMLNEDFSYSSKKEKESDTLKYFKKLNQKIKEKQISLAQALQEDLQEDIGSFTFVFYDKKEDCLLFIRRYNPLVFIKTQCGLFWTSTTEMFQKALKLSKLKISHSFIHTKENILYHYDFNTEKLTEIAKIKYTPKISLDNKKYKWYYKYFLNPEYSSFYKYSKDYYINDDDL